MHLSIHKHQIRTFGYMYSVLHYPSIQLSLFGSFMRIETPGAVGANWCEYLYCIRCSSFVTFLSRETSTTCCGFNIVRYIGSDVRHLHVQLYSSSALYAMYPSCIQFLRFCNANWTSLPSFNAFFSGLFTLRVARSACPLLCGYRGLLVTCSMSHNCVDFRNSLHEN